MYLLTFFDLISKNGQNSEELINSQKYVKVKNWATELTINLKLVHSTNIHWVPFKG